MLKAIIFDFDYTLGDSTSGIVACMNYAFEQLRYPQKSVDEIRKTIGLTLKEAFFILMQNRDVKVAEEFVKYYMRRADEVMTASTNLYSGVKEMLRNLQEEGYKTAIVTTKMRFRVEDILKKFEATELIDKIVGSDDVKIEKPDPEGLLWTINYFGLEKSEVLYVGDSLVDAKTAENADVNFAAVLTGTTTREEFEKYKNVFIGENVIEVYEYIKRSEKSGL